MTQSPGEGTPPSTRRLYVGSWRMDVTDRTGRQPVVPRAALARDLARALEAGGAPGPSAVGLILTDDAELSHLNEHAMGQSGATDVLSFPLLPPSEFPPHPGQDRSQWPDAEERVRSFALPPGQRVHLGEVVVSVERAIEQAQQGLGGQTGDVSWSPADELRLLVTHGALHLCGWDHAEPEEESAMRTLEGELLSR
ncbi:MAG: rRNA maturation RNase YbeY [Chloroflexota bacterium]|nr:rRNA maturation RNase YbeY [Chloroflexota bacterium]